MEVLEKKLKELMSVTADGKRDLIGIYSEEKLMDRIVEILAANLAGKVDLVAAPESMGLILGTRLAAALKVPVLPIRNARNYQIDDSIRASYIDHSDNSRTLQVRDNGLLKGKRVLLADDWVSSAATMNACQSIVEDGEGLVVGIASIGASYNEATKKMFDTGLLRCLMSVE